MALEKATFRLAQSTPQNTARHDVRRALKVTLVLNIIVAVSKIVIGLASGALAITADGFNSLIDAFSNVVALVANRLAERPPDADHPYGHGRYETIAALAIGGFLLLAAFEVINGVLERVGGGSDKPVNSPLSFAIMIGTLVVNICITTYEAREGKRLKSELLIADAAHTRTDVWVTISVLVSMAFVSLLGWYWVDTVAALVIVVLILRAAWGVLRQTGSVLVDTAPLPPEQLTAWAKEVPAVAEVIRARSRGTLDAPYIDIDVRVAPETTTDHTAAIASAIRDKFNQEIPGLSEVEVHFVPAEKGEAHYALLARAQADALGLSTHEVRVSEGANGKVLEMHVEVPPGQTLGVAHAQVSQLEQGVQARLPDVAEVITHIEPALTDAAGTLAPDETEALKHRALALLEAEYPHVDWHHLNVYPSTDGFTLTMHVTLPSQITVEAAHHVAESAETLLRAEMPQFERVTIHTEPPETN
ncbi:MAG: cation diffusion facilitator family transporter [Chloroflexota bacterium]